uniref:Uncharacterized protein n=1 Tax=Molossus molossus TaxID=27622 RepID=A0A7J8GRB2_MOLMO|nr:hypothetical protein HJG59_011368 [Molossus molossus]
MGTRCPIRKFEPSPSSSELLILLPLSLASSPWFQELQLKGSSAGVCRSPGCCRTPVRQLAHKKLPLCHIKIQLKAPDKTLIKRLWKQMYPPRTRPHNLPNSGSAASPGGVDSAGSGLGEGTRLAASDTHSWR